MDLQYKNEESDADEASKLVIRGSHECSRCKGTGHIRSGRRRQTCAHCDGKGIIYLTDCPNCYGTGVSSNRGVCGTCKGKKTISTVDAQNIHDAKNLCSQFRENSIAFFALPIISLVAIAFTARPVWDMACVDLGLLFRWDDFPGMILLAAVIAIFKRCVHIFNGSVYDPNRGTVRAIGVITLFLGILIAAVAGPVKSNGYGWIESKAINELNKNLTKAGSGLCYDLTINRNVQNIYFGKARCHNNQTLDVVAKFNGRTVGSGKHKHFTYNVHVDYTQP